MRRSIIKNKKGGLTDLFLFMILAFIIVLVSGIFIYVGGEMKTKLHEEMDNMTFGDANTSVTIDETFGKVNVAYDSLYWIALFIIGGMILSIFFGSYLVTTKPIYFIPFFFLLIVAIIVGAAISNAYETIIAEPLLSSTYDRFLGANYILLHLPIYLTIIGGIGAIIMFTRMVSSKRGVMGYVGY